MDNQIENNQNLKVLIIIEIYNKKIYYKKLIYLKRNGIFKLQIPMNNKKNLIMKVRYHNPKFHFNKVFPWLKMYDIKNLNRMFYHNIVLYLIEDHLKFRAKLNHLEIM